MSDNHILRPIDKEFYVERGGSCCSNSVDSTFSFETEIDHSDKVIEKLSHLCFSESLSDVTLSISGTKLPAHKMVLASRSDYFKSLFNSGMKETVSSEVVLHENNIQALKICLKYLYTGKIDFHSMSIDMAIDIFIISNKYAFEDLEELCTKYFKLNIEEKNICSLLMVCLAYDLKEVENLVLRYIDKHGNDILNLPEFLDIPGHCVENIISRNSFLADEENIFITIQKWLSVSKERESFKECLTKHIRLPLLSIECLFGPIRDSKLFDANDILDAIKEKYEKSYTNLNHRCFVKKEYDVMLNRYQIISGDNPSKLTLLPSYSHKMECENKATGHVIGNDSEGVVIEFSNKYLINNITFRLLDFDQRYFSYHIEISIDGKDWVRLIDYDKYNCRGVQNLFFKERPVKLVRVRGTSSSILNLFQILTFHALYTCNPRKVDSITNIVIPERSIATTKENALVIEGVSRTRNALLNGNYDDYDWDNGYTCHQLGSGSITISFPQPYLVSTMRLLLWDRDDRYYSYYIESSVNGKTWKRIVDKTNEECRSWQNLEFESEIISYVRIVGTHNSANEVFHCVHFECPSNLKVKSIETETMEDSVSLLEEKNDISNL
ncbi:BTB/POZ-like domain and Coagulation factor 5/8 C-terminal type domain and Galactose-binding domain-like and BTB/POZ fold domain and BTB/Kelch-associated domain and BTB/POZ domain-containing protein [Strongyloides ratti]|uniref:BTB/POZ-like domain and Coagulation factor 5/8 C-terminal type domain and Galactose-binding domain-like and BTB/POZ fold domain and BTB/Kelch-associated domain and BTB/POZ domain-containing protein n=1 Tax=Strongyloides ratti TaxID=34506 RepID=A0A090MWV5_STRRB|nr:BTB/POZ-like domain and Coagulation factor 5/8 C-terminal type domain and Galactose-binding domain-like and BTB/POZ fold domain and BTB/Kelch-associated domain and BTB/POZ domain-containing protein [Strongyloides ratti]CEF64344.1 BTB/POZ-like domain and Coagulation factor 5/8 C-terminal type domain and Galactose-binding domain-like and BTB/POZ fold domain and BTB/Kelch-associated domain and BTB/POZ domain-containing protein [Strongyloides ratti]